MPNGEDHDAITELRTQCRLHCETIKLAMDGVRASMDSLRFKVDQDMKHMEDRLDHDFVRRVEFIPVQRIVYGLVALVLVSVMGALWKVIVS